MFQTLLRNLAPTLLSVLLAGCAALGAPPAAQTVFDLGIPEAVTLEAGKRPVAVELRAPSWLATSAMQYRLLYAEPQRRLTYAESRWVAPPAEMLALALDRTLLAPDSAGSGCRLRVHLDEWIQVFHDPARSDVWIALRASLLPARGETPVTGRNFAVEAAAPTADAAGGAAAAQHAVQRLASELAGWLMTLDPSDGQRLNDGFGCRPRN
jgi:cholesterol transport system auxiliary component